MVWLTQCPFKNTIRDGGSTAYTVWHCFHCLYYSNCLTLLKQWHACLYILLASFIALLEIADFLLSKMLVLDGVGYTGLTTRAPLVWWQHCQHYQIHIVNIVIVITTTFQVSTLTALIHLADQLFQFLIFFILDWYSNLLLVIFLYELHFLSTFGQLFATLNLSFFFLARQFILITEKAFSWGLFDCFLEVVIGK